MSFKIVKQLPVIAMSLAFGLFMGAPLQLTAQETAVSTGIKGRVTDDKGEPVIGAFVLCSDTKEGVGTDLDGNYVLPNAKEGNTIVISCLGYCDKTVVVSNSAVINVTLSEDLQELEATVVVGYGLQKKVNLTGAVSVQEMKDIENRPMTQASEALYGIPGLYVNQSSSKPGSDGATILVRGTGTLEGGAAPLVLVDGVEYTLEDLNPEDIESISVLKDASASIYGSKAANGVILVTTKSASKSKGYFNVRFKANVGVQQAISLPDMVNDPIEWMEMYNQAKRNCGKEQFYTDAQIAEYRAGLGTNPYIYPATNWKDETFKLGILQEYNIGVSGGNEIITYGVNGGYMNQEGVLRKSDNAQRFSLDFKFDANVTKNFKLGVSFNGNIRINTDPVYGVSDIMNGYNRLSPLIGTVDDQGRYLNSWLQIPGQNVFYNTRMILDGGEISKRDQRCLVKINADYTFPHNIVWKNTFAVDKFDGFVKARKLPMNTYNPKTLERQPYSDYYYVQNNDYNNLNLTFFSTVNWNQTFDKKHNVGAMAGFEWKAYNAQNFQARMDNYFSPEVSELSAGGQVNSAAGTSSAQRLASFFARVNYNYMEKYLIEFVARCDGSSKFAPKNRWGFFPAGSIGWRIDREDFMNSRNIDLLKFRVSVGMLGNQAVGDYKYMTLVNPGTAYNYSFDGKTAPGAAVTNLVDSNITWESTTSINIGADFAAFSNRLTAGLDVYRKVSENVLRSMSVPSQVGLGGPVKNIGSVGNYGVEFSAGFRNNHGDFSYGISGNVSYNINKVLSLKEELKGEFQVTKEGLPINSWYLYQADGYFNSWEEVNDESIPRIKGAVIRPGFIKYKDLNGDGEITDADRTYSGNTEPTTMYGFTLNFGWKGIELTANFQGVAGVSIYLDGNAATPFYNGAGVTTEWITDSWTVQNKNARLPILHTSNDAPYMHDYKNTQWLYDASYLRCKQLQLAYSFPKKLIEKAKMSRLQIFVNANNPFTFTKNHLFDPEMATTQANLAQYPSLRTFNGGVNINF